MSLIKTKKKSAGKGGTTENSSKFALADMPITEHLIELRQRLIKITIAIVVVFLPMMMVMGDIYVIFSQPLIEVLPAESSLISNNLAGGFMVQLKLCLILAVFVVIPFILYQIWAFVAPGLYRNEKRIAIPILLSSIVLFYTGIAFAYFIILQNALAFFINVLPQNVMALPEVQDYMNLAIKIIVTFGVAFEIPIFVFILVATGVVSADALAEKRRYVFLGCAVAAGVLSPPDVLTMFFLAFPLYLLFELGLLAARLFLSKPSKI